MIASLYRLKQARLWDVTRMLRPEQPMGIPAFAIGKIGEFEAL